MNRKSKAVLAALVLAAAFILTACSKPAEPDEKPYFAEFSAVDLDGNTVTEELFRDHKLTMFNIWATFCGPCINEMPDLAAISDEYADKGLQIVGIPIDIIDVNAEVLPDYADLAREIIRLTGAEYMHLVPDMPMCERLLNQFTVVPVTVFVDSEGNQLGLYYGSRSKSDWTSVIDELLKGL